MQTSYLAVACRRGVRCRKGGAATNMTFEQNSQLKDSVHFKIYRFHFCLSSLASQYKLVLAHIVLRATHVTDT